MKFRSREEFDSKLPVEVKVLSRGEDGGYLYPNQEYELSNIPDSAIACGIVYQATKKQNKKSEAGQ